MKKRVLALLMVFGMCATVVACGSKQTVTETPATEVVEEAAVAETGTEEVATEEATVEAVDPAKENIVGMNLLSNGDFSEGTANWGAYITKGGAGAFEVVDGVG